MSNIQKPGKMVNALEVLQFMQQWWDKTPADKPEAGFKRTPFHATLRGLTFLNDETHDSYRALKTEASRIGHFRQLLTTWKAVCKKLESQLDGKPCYEFGMPAESAVRMFPLFYEQFMPDLYYVLWMKNIFLGIKFSDEDRARVTALEKAFVQDAIAKEKQRNDDMFFNMFFGASLRGAFNR